MKFMGDIQEKQKKILELEGIAVELLKEKEKNEKLLRELEDLKENLDKMT